MTKILKNSVRYLKVYVVPELVANFVAILPAWHKIEKHF